MGELTVSVQVGDAPLAAHAPPQPTKVVFDPATALSVTMPPALYDAEQVAPQAMPAGVETTDPLPATETDTVKTDTLTKVAVTLLAESIVTMQDVPDELAHPLQPPKLDPASGDAVSATIAPVTYDAEQAAPQSIPPIDDLTVPVPAPVLLTTSRFGADANDAVTVLAASTVSVQVGDVVLAAHAPPQPAKLVVAPVLAVSVTLAPAVNGAEHDAPQEMPAGLEVTVPLPVTDTDTGYV